MPPPDDDGDPATWRLDVDPACIELYRALRDEPRELTPAEATQLVELVDAWRSHEHRKHLALTSALGELRAWREGAPPADPG